MTLRLQVLVLEPHGDGDRYAPALLQQGFRAQGCASLIDLYDRYDEAPAPLLVLAGSLDDAYMASTRMRALDAGLGIAVVGPFASSDQRVRAMQSGADVCLPQGAQAMEVVACLQALARRSAATDGASARRPLAGPSAPGASADGGLPPAGEPDDAQAARPAGEAACAWELQESGWVLAAPGGNRLRLTSSERAFMSRLLAAPGRRLSRGELMASLGKVARPAHGVPETDPGRVSASLRGVDVMVCRLRRKAETHGIPLPLRSVYRWGYMFAEEP